VFDRKRREFITLIGGSAAAWPLATRAQQRGHEQRIGCLIPYAEADAESRKRVTAFQQALEQLGWTIGRNVRIDYRWDISDNEKARAAVADLLTLAPDVILASAVPALRAVQQATRTLAHRLHRSQRAGRSGCRRKPCKAGRQYHRLHQSGADHRRKVD
jgi:putative tryptophan/tyrosine transport system substrate-binding protein